MCSNWRRSIFLLERFGFVPVWLLVRSKRWWYIWLLNVTMVFELLIFIGIEFHSFAPDTKTAFVPLLFFDNLYVHQSGFSSSQWYLVSESKLIFFTFESAETYGFLHIKDASFSRKILLKLIHFKSRNSGLTWSLSKYFPLLATFAAKLIHICTSYCSFSLHLPHIIIITLGV